MESIEAIDRDIGERVRALRSARGLTLDELAAQSGVSRAMLSRVERGESSPTAQLLNRICGGLGVTLSALLAAAEKPASPLRRRAEQATWRDPESGYRRRAVSPPGVGALAEIVEVEFPAGARVAFAPQHFAETDQQILVLHGAMEIGVGAARHRLSAGDCLAMRFGEPIVFRNPGKIAARYLVVIGRGQERRMRDTIPIRPFGAEEAAARLGELGAILRDAVENGASVNFMAGMSEDEAIAFWRGQLAGIAEGSRTLLVAERDGAIVGTVVLTLAPQPNAPHRAEIGKMLVHSSLRRQGLGRRLLAEAEAAARQQKRTLLLLDTQTGSAGEVLYRRCGWTEYGVVPNHSHVPQGGLSPATFFYKELS